MHIRLPHQGWVYEGHSLLVLCRSTEHHRSVSKAEGDHLRYAWKTNGGLAAADTQLPLERRNATTGRWE